MTNHYNMLFNNVSSISFKTISLQIDINDDKEREAFHYLISESINGSHYHTHNIYSNSFHIMVWCDAKG